MFERRLKIFLGIVLTFTAVLLLRAVHLQVFTKSQWVHEAEEFNKKEALLETTRGRILDHVGREIAVDEACMDACVDYRAISRNKKWITEVALARLLDRLGDQYKKAPKAERGKLLDDEIAALNRDIDSMWALLAQQSGQTREQIDEICRTIDLKVAWRNRYVQYKRYEKANAGSSDRGPSPWYRRWLVEGGNGGPKVDDYEQDFA